jgi:hypothetical protein
MLGVELLARRALTRHAGALGLALVGDARPQALGGAGDRLLAQLAVQRPVDDDRRRAVQLDQHAGGAGLVDVGLAEANRRRPVGVTVDLLVQLLSLGDERVGLLAQPQRLQIAVVDLVEVRAEDARVAQDLADRPPRAADQLRAADLPGGDRLAQRPRDRRRHRTDRQ